MTYQIPEEGQAVLPGVEVEASVLSLCLWLK